MKLPWKLCPPSALLSHPGTSIHTWLSFYQNNHSTSVILFQRKEIENISLMFLFLSLIGTGIYFCFVSQRYSSLYNLLGWLQRSRISTSDSWIHLSRKISSVHTVFIYNPRNCLLVRNLCVKLLSKRFFKEFIFHSWTIVYPWTKPKMPTARQWWWKTCTLSSFLGFSLSLWLARWFRAPHFDRYFGACSGKSSSNRKYEQ